MKELLRAGDTLVVWRLDRLGRSLRDLIGWMTYLDEEKVGLEPPPAIVPTAASCFLHALRSSFRYSSVTCSSKPG